MRNISPALEHIPPKLAVVSGYIDIEKLLDIIKLAIVGGVIPSRANSDEPMLFHRETGFHTIRDRYKPITARCNSTFKEEIK